MSKEPRENNDISLSTTELDSILESADEVTENRESEEENIEEYGVWVKVKPEDVEEEISEGTNQNYELSDLESETEENSLTDEEEKLLGELEEKITGKEKSSEEETKEE